MSRCSVKMISFSRKPSASNMPFSSCSRLESSSHLRSLPLVRTALALASNVLQRGDFRFQFRDGSRGTGFVSYAFFGVFQLGESQVVIVEFIRKVQVAQFVPVAGTLAEPLFR